MDAKTIFKELSESRLLKSLAQEKILFIGEAETIICLQSFFENKSCDHDYYIWQAENNFSYNSNYSAVVISSVVSEHAIYEEFTNCCESIAGVPILKLFTDVFVNLQAGCQLLQPSDEKYKPTQVAYAIASTPRSGSTFLCELLSATQVAGFPQEYLRYPSQILTQYCQFDCVNYLQKLMTHKSTSNGVFGTKLISHFLQKHLNSQPNLNQTLEDFSFIYLIRKDTVSQAVSSFLAAKTKTWHIYSQKEDKKYQSRLDKVSIEDADFEQIKSIHQKLLKQERFLEDFFKQRKISPLIVEYESLAKAPEENINKILAHLNILAPEQNVKILDKYRYKIYELMKSFKFLGEEKQIKIKLKTQKIKSDKSAEIARQYRDRYL